MMDGMAKDDPDLIATAGKAKGATPLHSAVGDLALIAFYVLLRVGEYTVKGTRNQSKQT